MPIQAAANKLKAELEAYGCPPVFPSEAEEAAAHPPKPQEEKSAEAQVANKAKGKKSKAVSKTGTGVVRQWDILKMMVDEAEIPEFADPHKWLAYFPPWGKVDLAKFGVMTDWRRSFITTSVNPYYDAFIRWQFRFLKERGRVKFGKRPNVFSPRDGQVSRSVPQSVGRLRGSSIDRTKQLPRSRRTHRPPPNHLIRPSNHNPHTQVCADHDRASGEGVGPQEYTIIKLKVLEFPGVLGPLAGKDVFLGPATLRPETMYGQTNCFVLPDGEYGAYEMANGDVLIISARCVHCRRLWGVWHCDEDMHTRPASL